MSDGPAAFAHMIHCGFDVMSAALDPKTSAIVVQIGDSTNQSVDSDRAEWWQPCGFASMPAAPTQGAASCQGIAIKHSDRDMCFAARDLRSATIYGNLKPGDSAVYETGSATAISLWKAADKSVNHMTADANGNSIFRRMSPTEDRFWAPWGSQWHDATGWHLRDHGGGKIDLTALGMPAPLNAFNSVFTVSADVIHLDAALLSLGRNTAGTATPVLQAIPTQVVMTQLGVTLALVATSLTDIAAQLSALGHPATTVAAAVTSLAIAVSSLGTLSTACSTKTAVA